MGCLLPEGLFRDIRNYFTAVLQAGFENKGVIAVDAGGPDGTGSSSLAGTLSGGLRKGWL